jgi:hypothetical protein
MSYTPTHEDVALVLGSALIITEEATALRRAHTSSSIGIWPEGEEAVNETYDGWMRLAYDLEALADRMRK